MREVWVQVEDSGLIVLRARVENARGAVGHGLYEVRPGGELADVPYDVLRQYEGQHVDFDALRTRILAERGALKPDPNPAGVGG